MSTQNEEDSLARDFEKAIEENKLAQELLEAMRGGGEVGQTFRRFAEKEGAELQTKLLSALVDIPKVKSAEDGLHALYALRQLEALLRMLAARVGQDVAEMTEYVANARIEMGSVKHGDLSATVTRKPKVPTLKKDGPYEDLYNNLCREAGLSEEAQTCELFRLHFPGVQAYANKLAEEDRPVSFAIPGAYAGYTVTIRKKK